MTENRRHFSRVKFKARIILKKDHRIQEAHLLDISLKGALVEIDREFDLSQNEMCTFEFHLNEADLILPIEAKLIYQQEAHHLGFRFCEMELDTLTHLRRLIELNIGNAELVQKELFFF
ncbi:MAG: hypothetical protein COB67_03320 [SAR324 cluster bacterium]|uniref:PilZ domain-containing protein n=1 Tax=SAR324 cluster bacterium TaxID=2024889 RepID=A0A2A4T918_9DELT|nr:MAG: hypothetical protein COB67_03320 [SAR324 cluster bacterium]